MAKFKTEQEKIDYIKLLKADLVSDTEIRKKIGEIWGLKKTARNAKFKKIFAKNTFELIEEWKEGDRAKLKEEFSKKAACFKHSGDEGVAEAVDENVKTLDDLLKVCEVDLNEWVVEKYIVNKWATARKNKQVSLTWNDGVSNGFVEDKGGMVVQPLYQVKAWLARRKEIKDKKAIVAEFRKALEEIRPKTFVASPVRSGFLYEIALTDVHIGKLAWGEETGSTNYDSGIAAELAKKCVATLISYVDMNKVERILLPVGNDFFNSDNAAGTTTAGTPQNEDGRWQNTFMKGAKLLTEIVEYLTHFAPVDIVVVQGNHDHERSFYLGEYLGAWFRAHPSVTVNNAPTARKYYTWHSTLIGMTHGSEEKLAELPLILATEKPKEWAATKWRFFQIGHFHREKLEDIKGVKVHVLPTFCAQDAWHSKKGYVGTDRTAEGLLFDKELGLIANYYFRVV